MSVRTGHPSTIQILFFGVEKISILLLAEIWSIENGTGGRGRPWLSHFQKDTRTTTASALLPLKNQRTPNQLDVTGSKQFVLGSLQIEVVPSVHIYGHQKFTNKTCCRSWFFWWCHWSILRINCKWMRGQKFLLLIRTNFCGLPEKWNNLSWVKLHFLMVLHHWT